MSETRSFSRKIVFAAVLAGVLGTTAAGILASRPSYDSLKPGAPLPPVTKSPNVRPGNGERLVRFSEGRTKIAFLYIHGFGASRAEGEFVLEKMTKRYRANTLYVRLPGHGTTPEDQARAGYRDYLAAAERAILRMEKLGEKVVVFGTSMGGLLTTHIASRYPDRITAVVLASPFYDYAAASSIVLKSPGGLSLIKLLRGEKRDRELKRNDPEDPRVAGFEKYWYVNQYYQALRGLEDLRDFTARSAVYKRVRAPVLMFYYYRDEDHQDKAASVPAMLDAFSRFGAGGKRHPLSRPVAVADGNHILFSKWIRGVDHAFIEKETVLFLDQVIAAGK